MTNRFDNLLPLDIDRLTNVLLQMMTQLSEDPEAMKREATSILQWIPGSDMPNPNTKKMRTNGIMSITAHGKQKDQESTENLARTFIEDLENLYNRYHTGQGFKEGFTHRPVMAGVDPAALSPTDGS